VALRRAVITAAGLGTRFLPASKAIPKEMFPIYDKPAIQYVVEEAVAAGIKEILVVISYNKWPIEQHFDRSRDLEMALERSGKRELKKKISDLAELADIFFLSQKEQKGLGHAVLCVERFTRDEPFALFLGDDIIHSSVPALTQLETVQEQRNGMVLAVEKVPRHMVSSYGIVKVGQGNKGVYPVNDLVEKPTLEKAPSDLGIVGRYILTPDIFKALRTTKKGALGEIQITDALRNYLRIGGVINAVRFQGIRYDAGDKLGLLRASIEAALRDPQAKREMMNYLKKLVKKGGV